MKGGLTYADAITTVSATYAEEIKTDFYGEKLNGLLTARTNDLRGIVNGIDYNEYDPNTDQFIVHHYNASNFRKEKIKNKRDLQRQLGLEENDKKMMLGIVSRLTDQKGMDLVAYIMDELCSKDDVQLVVSARARSATRTCSVTLTGNITERSPRISIIPRSFPTGFTRRVMRS